MIAFVIPLVASSTLSWLPLALYSRLVIPSRHVKRFVNEKQPSRRPAIDLPHISPVKEPPTGLVDPHASYLRSAGRARYEQHATVLAEHRGAGARQPLAADVCLMRGAPVGVGGEECGEVGASVLAEYADGGP
jgi:hypothetical protein